MAELTYWSDPHTQFNKSNQYYFNNNSQIYTSLDKSFQIAFTLVNTTQRVYVTKLVDISNKLYDYDSNNCIEYLSIASYNANAYPYTFYNLERPINAILINNSLFVITNNNIGYFTNLNSVKTSLQNSTAIQSNANTSYNTNIDPITPFINIKYISSDLSGRILAICKTSSSPTIYIYKKNSSGNWRNNHVSTSTYISFGSQFGNVIIAPNGPQSNGIPIFFEAINNNIKSIYRYVVPYTTNLSVQDISSPLVNTHIFNINSYMDASSISINNQWDIDASGNYLIVADPLYSINNMQCGRITIFNTYNTSTVDIILPGQYNLGKYISIDKTTNIIFSQYSTNVNTNTSRTDFVCGFKIIFENSIPVDFKQIFSFAISSTLPCIVKDAYIDYSYNKLHAICGTSTSTGLNISFPLTTIQSTIIDYPITRPYFLNTYQLSSTPTSRISIASILASLQYKDENNDAPGIIVYDISYGTLLNNPWQNVTYKPLIYTRDFAAPTTNITNTSAVLDVSNNSTQGFLLPADASGGYIDFNDPPNQIVNAGNTAITFKFRAWDQTIGSKFTTFDTSNSPYTFRADGGTKIQPGTQDSPFSQQEFTFRTRVIYEPSMLATTRSISKTVFTIELGGAPGELTVNKLMKTISGDISCTGFTTGIPANFVDNMGMYITDICDAGAGTFKFYANDLPYTGSVPPRNAETAATLQQFMRLPPYATIVFTQGSGTSVTKIPSITFRGWTQAFDSPYIADSSDCYAGAGFKQVAYTSTAKTATFAITPPAQFDISGGSRAYNTYLTNNYKLRTDTADESNTGIDVSSLLTGVPLFNPRTTNTIALATAIVDICDAGLGTFQYKATSDTTWSIIQAGLHLPLIRLIRFVPNGVASTMLQYPYISLKVYERDKISPSPLNTVAALPVAGTLNSYYYSLNNLTYTFRIKATADTSLQSTTTNINVPYSGSYNISINDILTSTNISGDVAKQQYSIVTAGINRRNFNISFNIVDTWNTISDASNIIVPSEGAIRILINTSGGVATQPGGDTIDISYRVVDSFAVSPNNILLSLSGGQPTQVRGDLLQGQQTALAAANSYGLQAVPFDISDASGGQPDVIQRHDGIAFNTRGGKSFVRMSGTDNSGEILADITLLGDISNLNSMYNVAQLPPTLPTRQTQFPLKPEIQWNQMQGKYVRTGNYNSSIMQESCYASNSTSFIYNGIVYSVGANNYGMFGNGSSSSSLIPVKAISINNAIQISSTVNHIAVVCSDGTIKTAGYNYYGQLGNGTSRADSSIPVQVKDITNGIQVACGLYHTAVLCADGTVRTFGYNKNGQLGNSTNSGTNTANATPLQVQGITNAVQVSCGEYHTAILCADGTIRTFGNNYYGQLGNSTNSGTNTANATPLQVTGITNAVQVACSRHHTTILCSDRTVKSVGYNYYGQLGNSTNSGSSTANATPLQATGITNAVQVACGQLHTVILCLDGTIRTFGYNQSGQLGNGSSSSSANSTPIQVTGINNAVQVVGGTNHTLILFSDGTIRSFGDNGNGQLGDGTITQRTIPVLFNYTFSALYNITNKVLPKYNITPLATTQGYYSSAVIIGNKLYTIGDNSYGQLGNGNTTKTTKYAEVSGVINPIQVAYNVFAVDGAGHTAVVCADGTVRTFGNNGNGQLGNGATIQRNTNPVQVIGITNAIQVACGGNYYTAVVCADGTVKTFGYNGNGQLGNGTTTQSTTPVQVLETTNAIQVSCGESHTAILCSNGTVRTFGNNGYYQLGNGTTITGSTTPVDVSGINNAVQVACTTYHTAILCADGTVRTFGYNGNYELGNGTTVQQSNIPVQVLNITNAVQIACGGNHTAVLCANGTVKTFGANNYGQLGDLTTTNRNTPVDASGITNAIQVSCGKSYTNVLCSDGTIRVFGENSYAQLDNGNTNTQSTPIISRTSTGPNLYRSIQPFTRCILEITPAMYNIYSLNGDLLATRSFYEQIPFTQLEIGRDLSGVSFPFILHSIYKSNTSMPLSSASTAFSSTYPRIGSSIGEVIRMFVNYPQVQSISNDLYPIQTATVKLNFIPAFAQIKTRLNASAFITYTDSIDETNIGTDVLSFTVSCISGASYTTLPATYNKSAVGVLITDISARHPTMRFEYSLENPRAWQPLAANIHLPPTARIRYSLSGDIATLPQAPIRPIISYRLWTGHDLSNGITVPYTNVYSNEIVSGNVFFESTIAIKPVQGVELSQLIKTRLFQDTQVSTATGVLVAVSGDFWTASGQYITTKATTDGTGALITQVDPSANLFIRPSGGSGTTDIPLNISGAAGYIMRATDRLWIKNTTAISTAAKPTLNFAYQLYSDISAGLSFMTGSTYALSNLTVAGGAKRFSDVSAQFQIRVNTRPVLQSTTYVLNVPPFLGSNVPADVSFSMATVSGVDQNADQLFYYVSAINTFGLGTFNRGKGGANISGGTYLTASESVFFTPASASVYTVVGQNPFITFYAADVSSGTTVNTTNYSLATANLNVRINVRPSIPNQFNTYQHPTIVNITPELATAVQQTGESDAEDTWATYIINASGELMIAGFNGSSQFGTGNSSSLSIYTKVNIGNGKTPKAVVGNRFTTFVICTDGTLQAAGNMGNMGISMTGTMLGFQQINLSGGRLIKTISTGQNFGVAIDASDRLQVFGVNSSGQLGIGSQLSSVSTATIVSLSGGKTPKQVSCGKNHTVVLCTDGTVQTCGNNDSGQLGTGTDLLYIFTPVDLSGRIASQVSAGSNSTGIVCTDGTVLLSGSINGTNRFTQVTLANNKRGAFVSCGYRHALILCTDGTVQGRGSGDNNVFANSSTFLSSPTQIFPLSNTYVVGLTAGYYKSVLYCADGTVKITGYDREEQLGLSSVIKDGISTALTDISNMRINVAQYGPTTAPFFYDVTAPTTYSYTATNTVANTLNVSDMLRDISFTDINRDPSGIALFEVNGPSAPQWRYRMSIVDTWKDVSTVSLSNALLLPITGQLGLNCVASNASKIPYTIKFLAWDSTIGISGNYFDISTNGALDQSGSAFSQMQTTLQSFVYQGLATYTNSRTQNFLSLQVNQSTITGENVPTMDVSGILSRMTFSPALTQQTGRPIGIYFVGISGGSTAGRFEYKSTGTETWFELQTATNLLPTTELRFIPRDLSTQTQTVSMIYRLWSPFIGEEGRDLSRNVTAPLEARFYSQTVFTAPIFISRQQQPATIYSAPTILNTDTVFNYRLPIAGDELSNNRLNIYNNGIPLNFFRHTVQRLLDLSDFSANRTQFRFASELKSTDLSGTRQFKPTFEVSGNIYRPLITISGDMSNVEVTDLFTTIKGPNTFINISGQTSTVQTIILWTRLSTYRLAERKEFFRINTTAGLLQLYSANDTDLVYTINGGSTISIPSTITRMIDDDWNFIRFSIFSVNQFNISVNNYTNLFASNYVMTPGTFNIQLGNNSDLQYNIDYRDLFIYTPTVITSLPPITALNTYQKSSLFPIRQYSDFVDISQYSVYVSDIYNPSTRGFFEYRRPIDASYIPILPQLSPAKGFAFSAGTRIRYRLTDSSGLDLTESTLPRITCYIYDGSIERFNAPNIVKDTSGQNLSISGDNNVGNVPIIIRFQIFKELQQLTVSILTPILYTNKYQLGSQLVPVTSNTSVSNSIQSLLSTAADIPNGGGIAITDIINLSGVAILQYRLSSTSQWKPITTLIQPPYTQQIVTLNNLKMGLVLPASAQIDISLVSNLVYSRKDASGNPIPYNIKFHVWDGRFREYLIERTYPVSFNQIINTRQNNTFKQTSIQRFAAFFSSTESTYNIPIYPTARLL
jgi:alpha-tubulin suppressor-like RCC1 family protein